ncbi:MAG: methyltransferase domain-containing protein [Methanomassiliicoccales archaeon]|nr:MAG: methyltransferase domain-containing protein [Methanomassiliicoccales archaeon]
MPDADPDKKMPQIMNAFSKRAISYEEDIVRIVPNYDEMLDAAVGSIPFDEDLELTIIDLGTGTGSLAARLRKRFPRGRITCVDMTAEMLDVAKERFKDDPLVKFLQKDFYHLEIPAGNDVIASSLALHHLITDDDKRGFYRKICEGLRDGGVFVNADAVLSSDEEIEELYMRRWREFMGKGLGPEEIEEVLERFRREDSLPYLIDELRWLSEVGFSKVDVIWKDHMTAVVWARR